MSAMIAAGALLAGCAAYPAATNVSDPSSFKTVQTARYTPSNQLRLMDCLYDGLVSAQTWGFPTFIRQLKRSDGYRLDVTWQLNQYLVIDLKDDGAYKLDVWTDKAQIPLDRELVTSAACVKKFEVAG